MTDIHLQLEETTRRILAGEHLTPDDAVRLTNLREPTEIFHLMACANRVRGAFLGDRIEFCAIVNAKSGRCSEDCSFCAQSSHYNTSAPTYPLMDVDAMVEAAVKARAAGALRFSIVTSGKGVIRSRDFDTILEALSRIRQEGLLCCASLGLLDREAARALKQVGVCRYHHNLETSGSFFPNICTTHDYEQRVKVLDLCREEGIEVCSGGIIGLGESPAQRVELAVTLLEHEVDSFPVNILNAIAGTPLEHQASMPPLEILKTLSVFRLLMPHTEIRTCGGRETNLRGLQPLMFTAGCNGTMIGNYLTTQGRSPQHDVQDVLDLGLTFRNKGREREGS